MRHIKDSPFGSTRFGVLDWEVVVNLLPEFGVVMGLVRHGH